MVIFGSQVWRPSHIIDQEVYSDVATRLGVVVRVGILVRNFANNFRRPLVEVPLAVANTERGGLLVAIEVERAIVSSRIHIGPPYF